MGREYVAGAGKQVVQPNNNDGSESQVSVNTALVSRYLLVLALLDMVRTKPDFVIIKKRYRWDFHG